MLPTKIIVIYKILSKGITRMNSRQSRGQCSVFTVVMVVIRINLPGESAAIVDTRNISRMTVTLLTGGSHCQ